MKVYLAGPMRNLPEFNFPAFFEAETWLHILGHYVHNPAAEDAEAGFLWTGLKGTEDMSDPNLWEKGATPKSLNQVLAEDIEWILKHADAVAVLPGWEKSAGARAEVSAALAAGITVHPVDSFLDESRAFNEITEVPPMHELVDRRIEVSKDFRALAPGNPFVALQDEVRVTSSTGGQKGKKLAQLGSLDPQSLLIVAEVSGFGASKYDRYNYLKGYDWSLSFDAMQRHLLAFWSGQDTDPESGLPHLGHAAWHALALLSFSSRGLGTDDRYKQEDAA